MNKIFLRRFLPAFLLFAICITPAFAQPKIQLVDFATGFNLPVDIAHCGDSRLFVVERGGRIRVLDSLGNHLGIFLDIVQRVNSGQNEQGLLGLAFHPNYAQNGYFFVNYTKPNGGTTRVARFSVKPNNPNEADPNSELAILEQTQPFWNHNGGCMKFGADGYLYISIGDGGSGGDPQNNGQKKNTFLGKILRVDVNNSSQAQPYVVPPDNPFVGDASYSPEIWSLGWRNAWRFSFDRLTNDMWIADVGQNIWEEIDFEPANTPGLNYGWRCYEGSNPYNTSGCQPASAYVAPIFEYNHSGGNGCSVTGGFVYRGTQFPDLYGCYLFTDYCSGRWWYTRRNADGTFSTAVLTTLSGYQYSSLGEDRNGELYVALLGSGRIQRVRELCSPFQISGTAGPAVCANSMEGEISLTATGATGSATFIWSNGATTQNLSGLNPGTYTVEARDGNNCIRRDTFVVGDASPPTPFIDQIDTVICFGQPLSFNLPAPPPGHVYQWYQNGSPILASPNGVFTALTTSTYQVQLITQHCPSALSNAVLVTVFPLPMINLQSDGNMLSATVVPPNSTVEWYFNQSPVPISTELTFEAEESGLYALIAKDPVGCSSTAEINLVVSASKPPEWLRQFSLSPNPTEHSILLNMELEKSARTTLVLTDSSQRTVFSQTVEGQKITRQIEMGHLPAGTYYLSVQTESEVFVRKVVKN